MPINLAVIGCGYWGPNLIKNFNLIDGGRVIYVCDLNRDRLKYIKGIYPDVKICQDYKKVIGDKNINAVCIATPAVTHFQIAKDCLSAGKHVLVEKPMALNSRDAKTLVKIAENKNKILMIGHTLEYNEMTSRLKKIIGNGELGKILYISMTRTNWGVFRKDTNVIWDLCPHDISVINYILDAKPVAVRAEAKDSCKNGIEEVAFVSLYYPGSIIVDSNVSWLSPYKDRKILIVGSKRAAVYNDLDDKEQIKIYNKNTIEKKYSFKLGHKEPLSVECRHFLDCIKKEIKPRSSGEEGLKVVRVLEAIQKSSDRKGKLIYLQ